MLISIQYIVISNTRYTNINTKLTRTINFNKNLSIIKKN